MMYVTVNLSAIDTQANFIVSRIRDQGVFTQADPISRLHHIPGAESPDIGPYHHALSVLRAAFFPL
jgi:hypothetical protein